MASTFFSASPMTSNTQLFKLGGDQSVTQWTAIGNLDPFDLIGLEVDHEFKLGRQLYGQIGRLFAPQNAVHIEGG